MSNVNTSTNYFGPPNYGFPPPIPNPPGEINENPTFTAQATFNIKFSDFSVLNTLVTRFAAMDNVVIQNTEFRLTDATRASIESETRKAAAKDAIQKAHDYAETFGEVAKEDLWKRVKATEVKDTSYYSTSTRAQLHGQKRVIPRNELHRDDLEFQPEDVRLKVAIEAQFWVD